MQFEKFASLVQAGVSIPKALELSEVRSHRHWPTLEFAISAGSGAVEAAELLAEFEEIELQTKSEISQAQQVPQSTKQLMLWLPWFGLVVAEVSGLGAFAAILSPAGILLAAAALGLSWLGSRISSRMISKTYRALNPPDPKELKLAIALGSGIGLSEALEMAGMDKEQPLVRFATDSGVNLRAILQAEVRNQLLQWRTNALNQARALGVRLMIPLGLTTLPAFLLITVAPILLGAITQGER